MLNTLAVIVVHFGSKKDTYTCVRSLSKAKQIQKVGVFVVEDGTRDLDKKELQTLLPKTQLLRNPLNGGFSSAANIAITKALGQNYQYILLLCNDITVSKNLLEKLIEPFSNPAVGITAPLITYADDKNKIWFAGGTINKTFCFTQHPFMDQHIKRSPKSGPVDYITGTSMMIRRNVFKSAGLFDEDYFLYWEDVDFSIRASEKGFISYFINEPLIQHKVSASTGTRGTNKLSPMRAYYYARNPFLFIKKHKYNVLTGVIGQIFIRLPFYIWTFENFSAFLAYMKGLGDGFKILLRLGD